MNRTAMTAVLLLAAMVAATRAAEAQAPPATRPNIVLITADDLGIGELGCYGGDLPTPHLDALAASGVRFTSGYVTAPLCAPSRAALFTGRYQTRCGYEFNPVGAQNADPAIGLPLTERTIADRLRDVGYATGLVGKWHLGGTAKFHPLRRGFDEFFGFLHEGHYYAPPPYDGHLTWLRRKTLPDGSQGRWLSPDGRIVWSTDLKQFEPAYDADNPIVRGSQPVDERANLTEAFTREAEAFITRRKAQPFFLCLTYNAPHSPLQAADAYLTKFAHIPDLQRRIFAAMVAQLDDGIGRVLARIRSEGLEDRTLVIFLSDNGGPTRELTSSNRPYRGEKGRLYEGGIRVPMLLKWPSQVPASVEPRMMSSIDLAATMLAAGGASLSTTADGVDLAPFLTTPDSRPIRERHYWRLGEQAALREGDWKLVREKRAEPWQLYDLAADPGETRNRAADEPARVKQLEAAWQKLDAEMAEPVWSPTPGKRRPGS